MEKLYFLKKDAHIDMIIKMNFSICVSQTNYFDQVIQPSNNFYS